ncbi:hypothetical protein D3C80_1736380 [compost metagenome]
MGGNAGQNAPLEFGLIADKLMQIAQPDQISQRPLAVPMRSVHRRQVQLVAGHLETEMA